MRGDGIAELDGQRYFVPFTLPGETVEAEPRDKRGEGIAADLLEVLAPSRHREAPPCAHFKVCGGCALQHWRRDAYTAWKVELIVRALAQRGVDAPRFEPPLVGAPGERRRVDFVLRRQGRRVLAGFHERASPQIVDVGTCVMARPGLNALLGSVAREPRVRAARRRGGRCDRERDRRRPRPADPSAPAPRPVARAARGTGGAGRARRPGAAELGRSCLRRAHRRPTPAVPGFGEARVEPPPGAFLQATQRAEQAMRAAVDRMDGRCAEAGRPLCRLGRAVARPRRQAGAVRERQAGGRGGRGGGAQARRQR